MFLALKIPGIPFWYMVSVVYNIYYLHCYIYTHTNTKHHMCLRLLRALQNVCKYLLFVCTLHSGISKHVATDLSSSNGAIASFMRCLHDIQIIQYWVRLEVDIKEIVVCTSLPDIFKVAMHDLVSV